MTAVATNPAARSLKRLWSRLPAGPLGERELDEAIIRAGSLYEGDYAAAQALRSSLVIAQAVTVRPGDKPREPVYERVHDFPEHEETGVGTASYNATLLLEHEAREREMREQDRLRAAEWATSPLGVEREQMIALIDQRIDQRIGALLKSLDGDSVSRLRERLTAANDRGVQNDAGTAGEGV